MALDPSVLVDEARSVALDALRSEDTIAHLARTVSLAALHRQFRDALNNSDLSEATISIAIESPAKAEETELRALIESSDLETIVRRFPIRDTPVPDRVARALRFASLDDYQRRLRQLATRDEALRETLRSVIGLPAPTRRSNGEV